MGRRRHGHRQAPAALRLRSLEVLRFQVSRNWLGRKDSNLRIRDPKSRALPLGHAPGQTQKSITAVAGRCGSTPHAERACGVTMTCQSGRCSRRAARCRDRSRRTPQKRPIRCPRWRRRSAPARSRASTRLRDPGLPADDGRLQIVHQGHGSGGPARDRDCSIGSVARPSAPRPPRDPRRASGTRHSSRCRTTARSATRLRRGMSASGYSSSPRPSPKRGAPHQKKRNIRSELGRKLHAGRRAASRPFQSACRPASAAAASALPPPSPAATGICLRSVMATPAGAPFRPMADQSKTAARHTRFVESPGARSESVSRVRGPRRGVSIEPIAECDRLKERADVVKSVRSHGTNAQASD